MTRLLHFKQPAARQSDLRLPDVPLGDSFIMRRPVRHLASIGRRFLALVWAFVFLVLFAPIAIGVLVLMRREFEYEEVDPCALCSDPSTGYLDGHLRGEPCPKLMEGDCDTCLRVVALDRFGNCSEPGVNHCISNRRPATKGVIRFMTT